MTLARSSPILGKGEALGSRLCPVLGPLAGILWDGAMMKVRCSPRLTNRDGTKMTAKVE